ncbi:MAG: BlaI/MecI/CopY family transcriptional regulator [Planctomycetota bacterium]|jgi:predicted transcriptional regulator
MAPREAELGMAELEVLKTLWDHGPATVRQVLNHLHEQGRKLAYTTVLTYLTRLEEKGYVRSDKSGLAYVYRPKVSRAKVTKSRLRSLIEELYDGAAGPLVLQLMREHEHAQKLSAAEIEELQKLINQMDAKAKRSRPRRAR